MKISTNTNREETTQIVRKKWLFTAAAELGKRPFDEMGVSLPEAACVTLVKSKGNGMMSLR